LLRNLVTVVKKQLYFIYLWTRK